MGGGGGGGGGGYKLSYPYSLLLGGGQPKQNRRKGLGGAPSLH